MLDVVARLSAPDLTDRLRLLGFRDDDAEDVLRVAATVVGSRDDVERIRVLSARLLSGLGDFCAEGTENPWDCAAGRAEHLGVGVLPILTLLVTADEVHDFHRDRGVPDDVSWKSLSDLGQQVWVHRQTFGEFGLHTYGWLCCAWSGALYWLGRLQFNMQLEDGEWVLSSHIPRTGQLTPESVDDSFQTATRFFADYFGDYATKSLFCSSWLLDPQLAQELPDTSNMARFQRRWGLYGEPVDGDDDALFFTFLRRGDVDLEALPRDTTLQRVIIDRLKSGGHWSVWKGRITQPYLEPTR